MEITTLQVGTFEVNCTILSQGPQAWIVDPGAEAERLEEVLSRRGLTPAGILLTHAHFDHIGGIPRLQKTFPDLPVYAGEKDAQLFGHALNQLPPDYPPVCRPSNLQRAEDLTALPVEVIATPGHTPGGVCYHFPNLRLLLSGDTLFAGSVGRTDLPGGDMATLMASLERLTVLPDDTRVIPGHGPETTIGAEKRANPFLVR